MKNFAQLVLTAEGLSESGALGATEDALAAAQVATDVAEGNVDMLQSANDADAVDTSLESAFEAGDHVEELLEGAQATLAEGGMSEKEAKLLEISHESIMSNLGMGHRSTGYSKSPVLTIESYGETQTKMASTVYTCESLKESAAKIYESLIIGLKAGLNIVVNFIVGLTKNRALMERHLKNLEVKAKALDDSQDPKEKTLNIRAAKALSVNGVADSGTAMKILMSSNQLLNAGIQIAGAVQQVANPTEASTAIKAALNSITASGVANTRGRFTNDRQMKVATSDDGEISVSFTEAGRQATSIATLDKAGMQTMLTKAMEVVRNLISVEKTQGGLKAMVDRAVKLLSEYKDVVLSKVGTEASKEKAAKAVEVKRGARLGKSMMTKVGASFPAVAYQAVKAVADWVTASLNAYGVKPAPASETPPANPAIAA